MDGGELEVTVHLDRQLELQVVRRVRRGATVGELKADLAREDPTGQARTEDFVLAPPARGGSARTAPLADTVVLTQDLAELYVCSPDEVSEMLRAAGAAEEGAEEEPAAARPQWEVVGGSDRGGILVRAGQDLASAQLDSRLATGALVEEIELVGERLHFSLVSGDGPGSGWVSLSSKGRDLLVPAGGAAAAKRPAAGWADLAGQSVGPWAGHADKVTRVLFDRFSTPPEGPRRLYTCCWMEARVRCWELSKAAGGARRPPPPRLVGEISTHGLVSDVAAISPHGLLTAVSANPPSESGSVCHQADFKQRMAEQDDQLGPGDTLVGWDLREQPPQGPGAVAAGQPSKPAARCTLHANGCHALSLWPTPGDACWDGSGQQLLASVSKDVLGVSRIAGDGVAVEEPATWSVRSPHGDRGNPRHVCWGGPGSLWSCDRDGSLKLWDVGGGAAEATASSQLAAHKLAHVVAQPAAGLLMGSHEDGIAFFDTRDFRVIRHQYTKHPATAVCVLPGRPEVLFAGVGNSLMQYETRMLADGRADSKSTAVGTWTLPSPVLCLDCVCAASGHPLIAAGCQDGSVAAFDTS